MSNEDAAPCPACGGAGAFAPGAKVPEEIAAKLPADLDLAPRGGWCPCLRCLGRGVGGPEPLDGEVAHFLRRIQQAAARPWRDPSLPDGAIALVESLQLKWGPR